MKVIIKDVNFEKIYDPYEIVTQFGTVSQTEFILHNSNSETIDSCIIYLTKTENLGDIENPGTLEPYIDIEHIIKWGNEKTSNSNNVGYVALCYDGQDYIVTGKQASEKSNGIEIGPFSSGEQKNIIVKVEVPTALSSRRLLVNLAAE